MSASLIDALLNDPRWAPLSGWHDDHRDKDTSSYRPALMQVRDEFLDLLEVIELSTHCSCLQLGLGLSDASHEVFRVPFARVVTIDRARCLVDDIAYPGLDTHTPEAFALARDHALYDLVFVDAGHSYDDVARDHADYLPLVRPGSIMAFHDALPRPGYPEVEVYRFLETLSGVRMIGTEVGIAWVRKTI